ncbi:MAG TPA: acyltransferase [Polyangiaceae bacterium]|nr:acyltransferase [Polyangiaceae bacterium]
MSTSHKLREIERLRACAILMVMVVHWEPLGQMLPEIARHSWSGVDLFFVISGYVVALSLLRLMPPLERVGSFVAAFPRSKPALRMFYARRFFRIMPAALAAALVYRHQMKVFADLGPVKEWTTEVVCFFGGVYNYAFAFHGDFKMGPYWSLAVEEHFYLLLPVLFVVSRTKGRRLLACLAVGAFSVVSRSFAAPPGAIVHNWEKFTSHLRFDSLMAGVALALLVGTVKAPPAMPPRVMRFFVLPSVLVLVACLPGSLPDSLMHTVGFIALWMLSGVLVAFAGMDRGYVLGVPVLAPVLEYIGSRSYALYLLHIPASSFEVRYKKLWPRYGALVEARDPAWPWREVLVLFALSFLMAEVLHRVVEKPFMALGRRLIEGWRRREQLEGHPEIA